MPKFSVYIVRSLNNFTDQGVDAVTPVNASLSQVGLYMHVIMLSCMRRYYYIQSAFDGNL